MKRAGWLVFLLFPESLLILLLLLATAASAQVPPAFNYPAAGPAGAAGATGATGATGPAGPGPNVSMLAADATNATSSMAATGISVPLAASTKYAFLATLRLDIGAGVEGCQFDFDASTAGVADFWAGWFDESLSITGDLTTSAAADYSGPTSGTVVVTIHGSIETTTAGTLALRHAQASHLVETLRTKRGSWLVAWPVP